MITRLFLIAVTPSIALGAAIYLTDRYDREPLSLLAKIFVYGALTVIPVFFVEKVLLMFNIFPGIFGIAYSAFIVAGFTEEYFKRWVVLKGAFNSKHFNEKLDGIVYCVFSALGFATIENIMYVVFRFTGNYYVGVMRGILSVPAHTLFAVTMGYYLSLAKYTEDPKLKSVYFSRSLIIPILLHGLFNFILMAQVPYLMILFIPYVIYLWRMNLIKLNKYTKESRDEFNRINDDEI
ncbi:PrsW family intramembrane metalloprotease [Alkaliphilus peptidifermentans]|uniref:Protease PrsW n=1 Tax=Alkaliphilus peptidifermentans DSM 18978 TaxID=1120976 RepID=A0A1G5K3N8_9FIRM|nr:PrsW family glutamic-type intramembrane protease [Alkaliphilus peptidifermentans]SCY95156.1 Membrane proteinase PrsW, cleaves anti-sigma factor RsiW, M82 family [Alkaliphilus peptidifermentans DSM 18978]